MTFDLQDWLDRCAGSGRVVVTLRAPGQLDPILRGELGEQGPKAKDLEEAAEAHAVDCIGELTFVVRCEASSGVGHEERKFKVAGGKASTADALPSAHEVSTPAGAMAQVTRLSIEQGKQVIAMSRAMVDLAHEHRAEARDLRRAVMRQSNGNGKRNRVDLAFRKLESEEARERATSEMLGKALQGLMPLAGGILTRLLPAGSPAQRQAAGNAVDKLFASLSDAQAEELLRIFGASILRARTPSALYDIVTPALTDERAAEIMGLFSPEQAQAIIAIAQAEEARRDAERKTTNGAAHHAPPTPEPSPSADGGAPS